MNKALFIGHSLVGPVMPTMFNTFTADQGSAIVADVQIINGAPLRYNWDNGAEAEGVNARDVLPSGDYGSVVVTEAIPLDQQIMWNDTQGYAKLYSDLALSANAQARFYVYEIWHEIGTDAQAWRDQLTTDLPKWEGIVDYVNANAPAGAPEALILPAGQALGNLHDAIVAGQVPGLASIHDLFSDNIHLNDMGAWFVAAVHAAAVAELDPAALPLETSSVSGNPYGGPDAAVAQAMAGVIAATVAEFAADETPSPPMGDAGDNVLLGDAGDNVLDGRGGDDLVSGEAGDDVLSGGNNDDTVEGGEDNDLLRGNGGQDSLVGGTGMDSAFGGSGNDQIAMGAGDDSALGQGQDDTILGDAGSDTLRGGSGDDRLEGGEGDDFLFGNGNNDTIYGGDGADSVQGNGGSDHLFGEGGDDTLSSGLGGDRLDGGAGNDTLNGGDGDGARDTFVFMLGHAQDRIVAFAQTGLDAISDRLELDVQLWSGIDPSLTAQDVVDTFGTLNETGTILTLDFGGGDVLEVQNAAGITQETLGADIVFI